MIRSILFLGVIGSALGPCGSAAQAAEPTLKWGTRITWSENDGPKAREHGAMVVDPARDRMFLIGGSGYSPYLSSLSDVWQLELTTKKWCRVLPVIGTPSGGSRRVASVPQRKLAYLFGGYDDKAAPNAELYRFDYSADVPAFTVVTQENVPPPRSLHAFIYDPKSERFFLFGGIGKNNEVLGDTWSMSLQAGRAVWTKLLPQTGPTARYGFLFGFDAEHGRLILFSGAQGVFPLNPALDTWSLNTRSEPPTWSLLVAADQPGVPPGRRNGCGIFDPERQQLIVFGGTADAMSVAPGLFVLDTRPETTGWSQLDLDNAPPLRASGFGFYDSARKRTVLGFGNSTEVFRDLTSIGN